MVKGNPSSEQRFTEFLVISFLCKVVRGKVNDIHIPGKWPMAPLIGQEIRGNSDVGK